MIERFIKRNITTLNHHLTMGYLESKGIYPTEDEAIIITNFLKENYEEIIKNDSILSSLKGKIRDNIYQETVFLLQNLRKQYL